MRPVTACVSDDDLLTMFIGPPDWAGHPMRCYRTILNHILTTTTDTEWCVTAQLVDHDYPRGVKISDAQFASIALEPHQIPRLRNYTIRPRSWTAPQNRHLFLRRL